MPNTYTLNRNINPPTGETHVSSGWLYDGRLWITGDLTATAYSLRADGEWEAEIQFSQYQERDPLFLGVVDGGMIFFGRTTNRLFDFRRADGRAILEGSPVIIVSNIASYDAAANQFEDAAGNGVAIPDGAIVTLPQAVYDAAVADADVTPNPDAIFLTR